MKHAEAEDSCQSAQRSASKIPSRLKTAKLPSAFKRIKLVDKENKPRPQVSILIDIGKLHVLFRGDDRTVYARVRVGDHDEVFAITSTDYREVLVMAFHELTGEGCRRGAVDDALLTLASVAKASGRQEEVFLRIGRIDDKLAVDCGDPSWRTVVITANGVSITQEHVVNFRRSGKLMAIPSPSTTPDITKLWQLIHVHADDRPLILGWLLSAFSPRGPYPVLLLMGEQGSGKLVLSRLLKRLVDPSAVLIHALPKNEEDLLVAAISGHVLILDNLRDLRPQMSDALCRISTGGALSGRTLYTNAEETLIQVQRPVILNGIGGIVLQPDLSQRCIQIELHPSEVRCTETELEKMYQENSPHIIAALFDALSMAMRDEHVRHEHLPRMADAAGWAASGMQALGYSAEVFLHRYRQNEADGTSDGLESSPFAMAVADLVTKKGTWRGSAESLMNEVESKMPYRFGAQWPRSAKGAVTEIKRMAPCFRKAGISFEQIRDAHARTLAFHLDSGSTGAGS